jgi:rubrerythrin
MTEDTTQMTQRPMIGASVWEEDLYDHLTSHIERERESLQAYAEAAAETDSKAFAYVVGLLNEDERRHHALFISLAESLRVEAELRTDEPSVPYLDLERTDTEKVRALTRQLLHDEENDARELKRLHRLLHDVKDTTLWDLIVELMRRDTDKHIAVLEFVLRHTDR